MSYSSIRGSLASGMEAGQFGSCLSAKQFCIKGYGGQQGQHALAAKKISYLLGCLSKIAAR